MSHIDDTALDAARAATPGLPPEPVLSVLDLAVQVATPTGPRRVVEGVSFEVGRGETLCIAGESGSGKSITSLALMGLLPAASARVAAGEAWLAGREILALSEYEMRDVRGAEIAMIFQEPMTSLNPVMSIGAQLEEAVRIHERLDRRAARARALEALEAVRLSEPKRRLDQYPHELSGGMRQRVMIAMALACRPKLLIADEPTTALDVTIQAQILELMRELQRATGMGLLLITHDMGVVAEMADRVLVLREGKVVEQGGVREVFAFPRAAYTRNLLAAVPRLGSMAGTDLPRRPGAPALTAAAEAPAPRMPDTADMIAYARVVKAMRDRGDSLPEPELLRPEPASADQEALSRVLARMREQRGEAAAFATPAAPAPAPAAPAAPEPEPAVPSPPRPSTPRPSPTGEPVVFVRDLTVRFDIRGGVLQRPVKRVHAVEGISFELKPGETLSLVGESGCGKSTAARALMGLVPFTGEVVIAGTATLGLRPSELKPVRRNIQMVFQDPYAALDPRMTVGRLVGEPLVIHGVASGSELEDRVAGLFRRVGLTPEQMTRHPHEFSGGQRQRINIARALALSPKVIIADESVSALDVTVQRQVLDLLLELQAERGIAYVFISHDMAVVEEVSHRVAVMYLGQIVEEGPRRAVFEAPRHPYTRRLMASVPIPDPARARGRHRRLEGEVPSPVRDLDDPPARVALADLGGGHRVAEEALRASSAAG